MPPVDRMDEAGALRNDQPLVLDVAAPPGHAIAQGPGLAGCHTARGDRRHTGVIPPGWVGGCRFTINE